MKLRAYKENDAAALAVIYRRAVMEIGPGFYSPIQVAVWARVPDHLSRFREMLAGGSTLVAEIASCLVGFGQLYPEDHFSLLYVDPAYSRRGIASAIYQQLEADAVKQGATTLGADAGKISKAFFIRRGYDITKVSVRSIDGIAFEQYWMLKRLEKAPSGR
ncbi:MAG: GNAT family N-acetyltransferase [Moraxellaceae bacterium]|nr:MAG: GNAT family N-acetyltransferase [Moraxellaceae bacterium]